MLEMTTKFDKIRNRNVKCPSCRNYDPKKMFQSCNNDTLQVMYGENNEDFRWMSPVICGCCGTTFIRPYDLAIINGYNLPDSAEDDWD